MTVDLPQPHHWRASGPQDHHRQGQPHGDEDAVLCARKDSDQHRGHQLQKWGDSVGKQAGTPQFTGGCVLVLCLMATLNRKQLHGMQRQGLAVALLCDHPTAVDGKPTPSEWYPTAVTSRPVLS